MKKALFTAIQGARFLSLFLIVILVVPLFPLGTAAAILSKGGFRVPQEKQVVKISDKAEYVNNEVVVRFAAGFKGNNAKINKFANNRHLEKSTTLADGKIAVFRIKDGKSVKKKVEELVSDPSVAVVQPNYQYKSLAISTNDTYKTNLWGLDNTGQTVNTVAGTADADIDAPEAWAINEGTNGTITVAIIDSGVAYNHPDLLANMWDGSACVDENGDTIGGGCLHGYDFENDDNDPLPDSSTHGTHVAGIIAAVKNNSKGVVGVAPNAKIMALKSSLTTEEIVRAIAFAQENGAKVINASWGGYSDDPVLDDAIANFNGLFIASAGNDAVDNDEEYPAYPCALTAQVSNMICVAATDQDDALAYFSNYGATTVDVAAPGVNIFSSVAYTNAVSEDFQGVTVPNVPATWTKTGDFGTVSESGDKKLVGDTNQSPYLDNANNTTTSAPYDTSASRNGYVLTDFDTTCDTEYNNAGWTDFMEMDSSSDGGITWSSPFFNLRWDEQAIDSDSDPAGSASYQVQDAFLGVPATESTKLRFRWSTNGNADANHAGCTVNNLKVKYLADGSGETYEFMDGTSMAAPMVTGAVALAWGYRPTLSFSAIKEAVVDQGDTIVGLDGMVSSGKRLNVKNTLQYLESAKNITDIDFIEPTNRVWTIDHGAGTIDVIVAVGTDVTALTTTIEHEGASVSPASGTVQDFTNPVTYTVTALDGSTKDYVVTVTVATQPTITSFDFSGLVTYATIDNVGNTVAVTVPYGTNVTNLTPIIVYMADTISPDSGVVQDFTSPVTYTLTDVNGFETTYTVTVTVSDNPFSDTDVSFKKGEVSLGKTSNEEVKVNFDGVENMAYFMVSRHEDFGGASWEDAKDSVKIHVKKESGKQKFYFRFKDSDGVISETYTKTITYVPEKRTVKNSQSRVKQSDMLTQSGKYFAKNASVDIYYMIAGGTYNKVTVKTDAKGSFSDTFKVNNPKGKYLWYVLDTKTGKKSKTISYTVVE